jgi:hypothetical protein
LAGAVRFISGFAAGAAFFAVAMTISLIKLRNTPNRSSGGAIHQSVDRTLSGSPPHR